MLVNQTMMHFRFELAYFNEFAAALASFTKENPWESL